MKKALFILLLLGIITGSFGYILLKIWAHSDEQNYFNTSLRVHFAKYPKVRNLLALQFDGDAKEDYLGDAYEKILIEVDGMDGLYLSDVTLESLATEIRNITGKPVDIMKSDMQIPHTPAASIEDIRALMGQHRFYTTPTNKAILYLFIASQDADNPAQIGSTLEEDAVVLFYETIKDNAGYEHPDVEQYALGTILHEFGHQLGLPHNEMPQCLMNPQAEFGDTVRTRDIVIDFCEYEKNLLQ